MSTQVRVGAGRVANCTPASPVGLVLGEPLTHKHFMWAYESRIVVYREPHNIYEQDLHCHIGKCPIHFNDNSIVS